MTFTEPSDTYEIARSLAKKLACKASSIDLGLIDAQDSYDEIRKSGLLGALVPKQYGGFGLSFGEYTRLLEILGRADGASALGFNMHNVAIGSICDHGDNELPQASERFRDWAFGKIVDDKRMFASATSELSSGAKLSKLTTTYEKRANDEYLLNGEKSYVSLAEVADFYVVAARSIANADTLEVSHFVVAKGDPGVVFHGDWDGAALRGTRTKTMTLNSVLVPRNRLFMGIEGLSLFKVVREPQWMVAGYIGAYLGIAQSIVDFALDHVAGDANRNMSSSTRADVARMSIELEKARQLTYHAAALLDTVRGTAEANLAVFSAKYAVGALAPQLAVEAIRICGSAAVKKTNRLERLLRESVFCSVMPGKPDECLEYVGKSLLGFNLFDVREMTW